MLVIPVLGGVSVVVVVEGGTAVLDSAVTVVAGAGGAVVVAAVVVVGVVGSMGAGGGVVVCSGAGGWVVLNNLEWVVVWASRMGVRENELVVESRKNAAIKTLIVLFNSIWKRVFIR